MYKSMHHMVAKRLHVKGTSLHANSYRLLITVLQNDSQGGAINLLARPLNEQNQ